MIDITAPSFRERLRGALERHEGFALGHDPMFEAPEGIADLAIHFLAKHGLVSAP